MDEPVARVSRRRLMVAAAVTAALLPLLVLGNIWASADDPRDAVVAQITTSSVPPKGVSVAPTVPLDPLLPEEMSADGTGLVIAPTTPSTRPIPSTTTTTQPGPASASAEAEQPPPPPQGSRRVEEGQAIWSDLEEGTCNHRTIAFDTVLRVTSIADGKTTTCVVAGRGPYVRDRILELERSVFAQLAPTDTGVLTVRIEW